MNRHLAQDPPLPNLVAQSHDGRTPSEKGCHELLYNDQVDRALPYLRLHLLLEWREEVLTPFGTDRNEADPGATEPL